jgi:hypothetical protein
MSGGTAVITGSASPGNGGSLTTGSGVPVSGCSSSSNLGALYLQTSTSAPTVWICGYNGSSYLWTQIKNNTINVVSLGADPTDTNDSTSAIQAAFNATCLSAMGTACDIEFPQGKYKTTSTLQIKTSYTTVHGKGRYNTIIDYEPTAGGNAALQVSSTSPSTNDLVGVEVHNLGIFSSNTNLQKYGFQIVACSRCTLDGFMVDGPGGNFTGGAASIGLQTKGHELSYVGHGDIYADEPIEISPNPDTYGGIQLDLDQWTFDKLYLIAHGHPNISVDSGTLLTSDTFRNIEAPSGTYGFYWNNSNTGASMMIRFQDFRTEQGSCSTCQTIYISNSSGQIQNVEIDGLMADYTRAGIYLNGCVWCSVTHMQYVGSGAWLTVGSQGVQHLNVMRSPIFSSATCSGSVCGTYSNSSSWVNVSNQ